MQSVIPTNYIFPEHLKIFMEYRQETGVIRTDLNNNRKRMLQFRLVHSYFYYLICNNKECA